MLRQHLQLFEIGEEQAEALIASEPKFTPHPAREPEPRGANWFWWLGGLTAAAAIVIFLSLSGVFTSRQTIAALAGVDLQIKTTDKLVLAPGQNAFVAGHTANVRRVAVESGTMNFRVTSGVNIVASGPVEFEFLDAMQMRLVRGQLTAEVEPQARGFTVLTPNGKVVDLGTKFGVDVEQNAGADVVVFKGKVEVHKSDSLATSPPLVSLIAGEAVRLDESGVASRINSISTGPGADEWSARGRVSGSVIASVTDNNSRRWSNQFYPIVRQGMKEGVYAWPYDVNKPCWWSLNAASMPAWLAGADMVQTLNEELGNRELRISVRLARPCTLYVFYEDGAPVPEWLRRDFTTTEEKLVLSPDSPTIPGDAGSRGSYQKSFRIWKRTIPAAGEYVVGPTLKESPHTPPFYMYGLAAKAL
jgi:hypothetical protein